MIVDMRLRPPLPSLQSSILFQTGGVAQTRHPDYPRAPSAEQKSIPLLISEMDAAGVQSGVLMGRRSAPPFGSIANDEIRALMDAYPGRFYAWAGLDLSQGPQAWEDDMAACLAHPGFRGVCIEPTISLDPSMTCVTDIRLYPIYDACQRRGVPVSITLSGVLQHTTGRPYEQARPQQIYDLARAFPTLDIHVGHAGYPWVMEMVGVAFHCRNVWLSPDLYMAPEVPGSEEYFKLANHYLPDRSLFGSNYPSKPLPQMIAAYRSWPWRAGVLDQVLHGNALRLMRLA